MKKVLCVFCSFCMLLCMCSCGGQKSPDTNGDNTKNTPVTGNEQSEIELIGEKKAKEIALAKASLDAVDVVFRGVELDFEDGIWEYEVEFANGKTLYKADINAQTGEIISFEAKEGD